MFNVSNILDGEQAWLLLASKAVDSEHSHMKSTCRKEGRGESEGRLH